MYSNTLAWFVLLFCLMFFYSQNNNINKITLENTKTIFIFMSHQNTILNQTQKILIKYINKQSERLLYFTGLGTQSL